MSTKNRSNTYLYEHKLNNQIAIYDIAEIHTCEANEVSLYDVILFKKDNTLIIHRVVEVTATYFVTQGDSNTQKDDFVVTSDMIMGKYNKSLPFMSFNNYLFHTPGLYVLLVGVTFDIATLITYEIKRTRFLSSQNL